MPGNTVQGFPLLVNTDGEIVLPEDLTNANFSLRWIEYYDESGATALLIGTSSEDPVGPDTTLVSGAETLRLSAGDDVILEGSCEVRFQNSVGDVNVAPQNGNIILKPQLGRNFVDSLTGQRDKVCGRGLLNAAGELEVVPTGGFDNAGYDVAIAVPNGVCDNIWIDYASTSSGFKIKSQGGNADAGVEVSWMVIRSDVF